MHRRSALTRRPLRRFSTFVVAAAAACGVTDSVPPVEGVIDRETFIEVYVDLRAETVEQTELTLPGEERDRILERHGVDAESLLAFVDAYGRELDFMNEVWLEIERRLDARSAAAGQDAPGA